jgi:hypothetical protein
MKYTGYERRNAYKIFGGKNCKETVLLGDML